LNSKKKISKIGKLLAFACLSFAFVLLFSFSLKSSHLLEKVKPVSYSEISFLDYKVCLKENTHYVDDCLGKNMSYIASLIDYLDIDFNYSYSIEEIVDVNYSYYIDAEITVFDKANPSKIIYADTKKIIESKSFTENNTNEFNVVEKVKIDYGEYNDRIRAFKSDYNLVASSNVTLKLYVQNSSTSDKYENPIDNKAVMSVVIPLTENRIDVAMDHRDINNKKIINEDAKVELNAIFVVLMAVFAFGAVSSLSLFVYTLFQSKVKKSGYEKYIEKLLREYDDIITEAVTLIDEDAYEIYDVKTFGELKNISDRLERQILFTEGTLKSGVKRTWFSLIDNDILYRVVIRSDEFEE